ncbi:uncharacterized protein BCR38DRAFT_199084 [Pseudomassariella vexata]|uniref:F-box domain-containing protein n=1 Tax=Pseudomassariella vexata TaxID=1141098 RepID=A0A1Y2E1Y5_9PEZI|nr:uncharacterized protein BCR38DRAFT_199084 [Pseudomassariella vexata]ORY65519.1 hypothetical protein BCR38DRAFT_199084 [Pseudomassariella vexata]
MLRPRRTAEAPPRRVSGLQRLPYEMVSLIISHLTIEETFDLALSCHHLEYLIRETDFCKAVVKSKAPYSLEAQEAYQTGRYSRAMRRLVKRRRAIANARPFMCGIVGVADSFNFSGGKLCYILGDRRERRLRILDLRQTTNDEIVVDIPALTSLAIPESAKCRKYVFRVLHTSNGITSCLFSFALPTTQHWLLIINPQQYQLIGKIPLPSASRIFVRNDAEYLYFGTHSEYGADGFRKWVLRGFDIRQQQLMKQKMHLTKVVGYEIGSTVCFEVMDGYFYGVSNQTAFEIEEIDWTSYYYCFRFRLNAPDPQKTQVMKKRDSWRRQHTEGPIDDRWGFISLEKDEASGRVRIVESRKEWLTGQSGHKRTYYIKGVIFHEKASSEADHDNSSDDDDDDDGIPDNPWGDLGDSSSSIKPSYLLPQQRSEHPGDENSVMFTRSQTYLRSYNYSCRTFFDLVNDPLPSNPEMRRLRLRSGARVLNKAPEWETRQLGVYEHGMGQEDTRSSFEYNRISYWPPEETSAEPNSYCDHLYRVLNPPGYCGSVVATSDERTIVYTIGEEAGGLKALVLLSFDPAVTLAAAMCGGDFSGVTARSEVDGKNNGSAAVRKEMGTIGTQETSIYERGADTVVAEACMAPILHVTSSAEDLATNTLPGPEVRSSWARIERAFHHDIHLKYDFAEPFRPARS